MADTDNFWAVIPAGGAGTRLWPLSRADRPKFLLDLTGSGRTLLQATVDRLRPLSQDRIVVVTGSAHRDAVRDQLPEVPADHILAEPDPRDSMPAIGWAAAVVERLDPDAVMGSFAADHVIPDEERFHHHVSEAIHAAADGWLVTLGIEPTHPATGYGYIRLGESLPGHRGVRLAERFVEKPAAEVAAAYVAGGGYRWNAGMFVTRPGRLLDLLARQDPGFAGALRELAASPYRLAEIWSTLPRIAVDHAVAEPAAADGAVAVVPAQVRWHDVGDFAALRDLYDDPSSPLVSLGHPPATALDAGGVVIERSGRRVVVVGIPDVVVVDTEDVVLVTTLAHSQRVKELATDPAPGHRVDAP